MILIKDEKIIFEKYFKENGNQITQDDMHALFSATKSINSLLVGILIDKGYIKSEEDLIYDYFKEYQINNMNENKMKIKIKDVLSNSSGFDWNEQKYSYSDDRNVYNKYINSENRLQFVLDLPVIDIPGSKFVYNTAASHLITALIQKVTGKSALQFANEFLFDPLEIDSVIWGSDNQGINKAGGLNLIPLDMAKIGQLVLNKGIWNGKRIISEEWINKSLQPLFEASYNVYFGYHWWITKFKDYNIFYAYGYGDQRIYIVPDFSLVFVTTANIYDDYSLKLLEEYIIKVFE